MSPFYIRLPAVWIFQYAGPSGSHIFVLPSKISISNRGLTAQLFQIMPEIQCDDFFKQDNCSNILLWTVRFSRMVTSGCVRFFFWFNCLSQKSTWLNWSYHLANSAVLHIFQRVSVSGRELMALMRQLLENGCMTSENTGNSSIYLLLAGWFSLGLMICGFAETFHAVATIFLFSLPGFSLLGRANIISQPVDFAVRIASGVALSLVSLLITAFILGGFSALSSLFSIFFLSAILYIARCKTNRETVNHLYSPLPWITVLIISLLVSIPLTGADSALASSPGFRPFFNADYFKHLALSQSIAVGEFPPIDPFGTANGTLHYYWLYHLIPATAMQWFPIVDPVGLLKAFGYIQTAILTILLCGITTRVMGSVSWLGMSAVVIGIAGLSLDGLYAVITDLDFSMDNVAGINQEAGDLTSLFGAPAHIAATTLFRLNFYIPQHQLCANLFLSAMLLAMSPNTRCSWAIRGVMNAIMPSVSLLFGIPAAIALTGAAIISHKKLKLSLLVELAPLLIGLLIPLITGMVNLSYAENLVVTQPASHSEPNVITRLAWLLPQLLTSVGALFYMSLSVILAVLGYLYRAQISRMHFMPFRQISLLTSAWCSGTSSSDHQVRNIIKSEAFLYLYISFIIAITGYLLAELFLSPGRLRIDAELKLSLLLNTVCVPLAAFWLNRYNSGFLSRWQTGVVVVIISMGLISPVYDIWWHNGHQQAHDDMTITIPPADMRAMQWIKANTPPDTVFQQYPEPDYIKRGKDTWIPIFAGRRIAVSPRSTNLTQENLEWANELYRLKSELSPSEIAYRLDVNYLYLSRSLGHEDYYRITEKWRSDTRLMCIYSEEGVSIWLVIGQ